MESVINHGEHPFYEDVSVPVPARPKDEAGQVLQPEEDDFPIAALLQPDAATEERGGTEEEGTVGPSTVQLGYEILKTEPSEKVIRKLSDFTASQ